MFKIVTHKKSNFIHVSTCWSCQLLWICKCMILHIISPKPNENLDMKHMKCHLVYELYIDTTLSHVLVFESFICGWSMAKLWLLNLSIKVQTFSVLSSVPTWIRDSTSKKIYILPFSATELNTLLWKQWMATNRLHESPPRFQKLKMLAFFSPQTQVRFPFIAHAQHETSFIGWRAL